MASKATIVSQWNTGARIRIINGINSISSGDVIGISYYLSDGSIPGNVTLSYVQGGTTISTVAVTNP